MPSHKIPDRKMPNSAVSVATSPTKETPDEVPAEPKNSDIATATSPSVASPQPIRAGRVQFGAVNFAKAGDDGSREELLSPTDGPEDGEESFLGE